MTLPRFTTAARKSCIAAIPNAPGNSTINVKHTVEEWSRRIKSLLGWHFVQLVDSNELWVAQVPNEGPVHAFRAAAARTASGSGSRLTTGPGGRKTRRTH